MMRVERLFFCAPKLNSLGDKKSPTLYAGDYHLLVVKSDFFNEVI